MDSSRCRARIREASRSYTALTLASDHAFWSYSKRQGARTTSKCGSRRLGIVSTYPYRAHTAEEAVTGAFPGLSGDIVDPVRLSPNRVGKGLSRILIFVVFRQESLSVRDRENAEVDSQWK